MAPWTWVPLLFNGPSMQPPCAFYHFLYGFHSRLTHPGGSRLKDWVTPSGLLLPFRTEACFSDGIKSPLKTQDRSTDIGGNSENSNSHMNQSYSIIPKARVELCRDERDKWLDKVLIRRGDDEPPIFETTSMVVDYFLSQSLREESVVDVNQERNSFLSISKETRHPLRRVPFSDDFGEEMARRRRSSRRHDFDETLECNDYNSNEAIQEIEIIFAPLFGTCVNRPSAPRAIDKSTTSEKVNNNKPSCQRINLKLTVVYRGRNFSGWQDQRHQNSGIKEYVPGVNGGGAGKEKRLFDHNCAGETTNEELQIKTSISRKSDTGENKALPSVQGTLVDILSPILGDPRPKVTNEAMINSSITPSYVETSNESNRQKRRKSVQNTKSTLHKKKVNILVAGRTDAGVSAIGQICRIRTRRIDHVKKNGISAKNILNGSEIATLVKNTVNKAMKEQGDSFGEAACDYISGLCIRKAECVGDKFHPTFGASSRAYAYLIDLEDDNTNKDDQKNCNSDCEVSDNGMANPATKCTFVNTSPKYPKISRHLVPKLDSMLRALEGKELDYIAFSYGKVKSETTLCTLFHARVSIVEWTCGADTTGSNCGRLDLQLSLNQPARKKQALCFELVGDRFLRRMVRILVATALREASEINDKIGAHRVKDDNGVDTKLGSIKDNNCLLTESNHNTESALLHILKTKDRRFCAAPAPPDGLIFVNATY